MQPHKEDKKPHVLIIEDDNVTAKAYDNLFKANGYDTTLAPDGQEALTRLYFNPYDVVLLDLILPHVDGLQVLETMRGLQKHSETPVVVLTNANLKIARKSVETHGTTEFLVKDEVRPAQLLGHLHNAMFRDGPPTGAMRVFPATPLADHKRNDPVPNDRDRPTASPKKGILNRLLGERPAA